MKAGIMINGLLRMISLMGDEEITIEIQQPDGSIISAPINGIKSGSKLNSIILTNSESK